ncbi:NAD(P)-dependent oxidoreductase [Rheinheimera mesophila]|uniref:NAD(P)-dependent oxidoreductase n=1 Tax=Rheinheimera mesophila TaxID=1547515 RepID=A0A3P3QPN4_9GAMM|nr:NAD(P)-dependent oxidoreductase [Rheinheimera mesophila]KKL01556.1 hypothetical protein SD53_09530 [Rheinheimera mesophila]RRJ23207.1 NAD(P)-dependent oxidoreductase [Rheinheimera mesophila]
MRVLLTGATGFIGQAFLSLLNSHGIEVVILGRHSPALLPNVSFIYCDLLNDSDLKDKVIQASCSHLVHLAWNVEHGKFWHASDNLDWVAATCRLTTLFWHAGGVAAVFAGSCAEYGCSDEMLVEHQDYGAPHTLYGVSKDATRRLVMSFGGIHQLRCSWARIFLPYGPGEAPGRIVPSVLDALSGKRPPFATDLKSTRDFIHVKDIAQALWVLLQTGEHDVYNLSSGQGTSISALIKLMAELLCEDASALLALGKSETSASSLLVGDNSKLSKLGWRPELSLLAGLSSIITESKVL